MKEIETIIAIDLEMLCDRKKMEYEQKETIRIGAVKYDMKTKKITRFDEFVKPLSAYPISQFCFHLTGITQEDVDQASMYPDVLKAFFEWIGSFEKTLIITWGEDDIPRLAADAILHQIEDEKISLLQRSFLNFQTVFTSEISYGQLSIENALKLLGLEFNGEKHRPCDDAYNTLRLYLEFVKNEIHNQIIYMQEICFKQKLTEQFDFWKGEVVKKAFELDPKNQCNV